ncbi:TetR/AcrR family transcriptional regulator [Streptomyces sp. NPDC012751]|uniref:TetR/AcrR family transcriptional regulator n=1 Tax=Streptomyces sp. NPDC012751 TaxID=3364846 RepID=UPI0036C019D0
MIPMTAAHSPHSPADRPRPGLRERKKIKTRAAIRAAAYALVREQGYDATTVEQIAERAEVSPSTVFRYFPAKEDIVLTDEYGPLLLDELRARPTDEPWTDSLRHVVRESLELSEREDPEALRLRARLGVQVPAVRSRYFESMTETGRLLRRALAERTGRDPESLEVRVGVMALIGGMMEVAMYWAEHGCEDRLPDLMERALDVMEDGPRLGNP